MNQIDDVERHSPTVSIQSPNAGTVTPRAPVAQWIERLPPEQKVAGSNPVRGTSREPPPDPRVGGGCVDSAIAMGPFSNLLISVP